jgi:hypothetical protein
MCQVQALVCQLQAPCVNYRQPVHNIQSNLSNPDWGRLTLLHAKLLCPYCECFIAFVRRDSLKSVCVNHREPVHNIQSAVGAALLDEVDAWRYALESRLGLRNAVLRMLYRAAVQEAVAAAPTAVTPNQVPHSTPAGHPARGVRHLSTGSDVAAHEGGAHLATHSTPAGLPSHGERDLSVDLPAAASLPESLLGVPGQLGVERDVFRTPADCLARGVSCGDACRSVDLTGETGSESDKDGACESGSEAKASEDNSSAEQGLQLGSSMIWDTSREASEVMTARGAAAASAQGHEGADDQGYRRSVMDGPSRERHALQPRDLGMAQVDLGIGVAPTDLLRTTAANVATAEDSGMRPDGGTAGLLQGDVPGGANCGDLRAGYGLEACVECDGHTTTGEHLGAAKGTGVPDAWAGTCARGPGGGSKPDAGRRSRDVERLLYARLKVCPPLSIHLQAHIATWAHVGAFSLGAFRLVLVFPRRRFPQSISCAPLEGSVLSPSRPVSALLSLSVAEMFALLISLCPTGSACLAPMHCGPPIIAYFCTIGCTPGPRSGNV